MALAGESEWVRNGRAVGGRVVIGRRRRHAATLIEVPPPDRPPVIRAYLLWAGRRAGSRRVASEARHYFRLSPTRRLRKSGRSPTGARSSASSRTAVPPGLLTNPPPRPLPPHPPNRTVECPARERSTIQLNVTSLVHLTGLLLPGIVERRRGGILNVASIAGNLPGPGQAVYNATKAFVKSFSQALTEETRGTGGPRHRPVPGPGGHRVREERRIPGPRTPWKPADEGDVRPRGGRRRLDRAYGRPSGRRSRPGHPDRSAGPAVPALARHRPHRRIQPTPLNQGRTR